MFELGQWNAICQRCGGQYKARKLRLEWTGLRVCHGAETRGCWEKRHPQDSVKAKADKQAPPWTSPRPEDSEVISNDWNDL